MSAAILLHTNLPVINRLVALMPAWARLCTAEKTAGRVGVGTSGLGTPVLTSHSNVAPSTCIICTRREELPSRCCTSGQAAWSRAICT